MRIKHISMYRIFQLIIQALSSGLLPSMSQCGGCLVFLWAQKVGKNDFWQIIMSSYSGCFVKLIFSAEFRSVPIFGIGSSAEIGMPRNEHFLPRNNGNHSECIPRNFFGTKFRSQPYSWLCKRGDLPLPDCVRRVKCILPGRGWGKRWSKKSLQVSWCVGMSVFLP